VYPFLLSDKPTDFKTQTETSYFSEIQIEITDPGKSNFLEFHVDMLRMLSSREFVNPGDPLWRGVFGYVAFGYVAGTTAPQGPGTSGAVAFKNAGFVNWKYNVFRPDYGEQPGACRVWMRKGTKALIYCWEKEIPREVGAVLLTPGLKNSNQP
jgi:hypothetical protein